METRMEAQKRRRILDEIQIDEISGVDRPCQQPALVTIMKRNPTVDASTKRKEPVMDFETTYQELIKVELLAGAPAAVAGQRVLQKYGAHSNVSRIQKTQGASERFMLQVEAVMDEKKCSRTVAMQEARKRHPDLYSAYQEA